MDVGTGTDDLSAPALPLLKTVATPAVTRPASRTPIATAGKCRGAMNFLFPRRGTRRQATIRATENIRLAGFHLDHRIIGIGFA